MDIPRHRDITYFAKTNYRDKESMFGIKRKDRRQHMYVLGKSGTGKSALMKNMIVQNIANGEGVAVVDPHGELVEDILELIPPERKDDVIYFNPADTDYHIGFNVLDVPDPRYKHLIASGLMGIFTKIWANVWSSRMEYILNNCILALLDTPNATMLGIPRLLVDQAYRQFVIENITDPVVKSFWITEFESWQERFRNEAIAPIQNKVGQFLSSSIVRNIVGQQESTVNVFDIMNNQKILLINVSKGRIGEDNSALLGAMMITKIQLAAMERVRIREEDRKDFYLYVDEFQNFVTDSFASILSEARKYRLCLTLAHQYIAQLTTTESTNVRDAIFGNVGTMIVFRIGAADAEFIETEFEPEFTGQDFVSLPNYTIYTKLMIDGVTSRPFSANTLHPFKVEGSVDIARQIIERSRELYARTKEDVEKEVSNWSQSKPGVDVDKISKKPEDAQQAPNGLYRIKCALFEECSNIAEVPFKPDPGRPVYCKEHIEKIKNGESRPVPQKKRAPDRRAQESQESLSSLGIAFVSQGSQAPAKKHSREDVEKKSWPAKKEQQKRKVAFEQKGGGDRKNDKQDNQDLKSVLQNFLKKEPAQEENNTAHKNTDRQQLEQKKKTESQQTISLADLQKNSAPALEKNSFHKKNTDRSASSDSLSSLKSILAKATQDTSSKKEDVSLTESSPSATPTPSPQKQEQDEQKKLLEKQILEAEQRAEELQKQIAEERSQREESEKEQRMVAEELLQKEKERRTSEETKKQEKEESDSSPEPLFSTSQQAVPKKEIPEDILESILE